MIPIGELAARAGVSAATVRYYEREGLLPAPARRSGRRVYVEKDIRALRFVVTARRAGFGIAAIRSLTPAFRSGAKGGERRAHAIAIRRRTIDNQIDQLTAMRALLAAAAACTCADILDCGEADKAMGL